MELVYFGCEAVGLFRLLWYNRHIGWRRILLLDLEDGLQRLRFRLLSLFTSPCSSYSGFFTSSLTHQAHYSLRGFSL